VNSRTDEKASIRVSEMVAPSGKLNFWNVNQELTCLWLTRVLLIFEPRWNARSTRKQLEVKRVEQKYQIFFLFSANSRSKLDDTVLAAEEGAFAFRTMKYHSTVASQFQLRQRTASLFCSATT
jgi:hypothetical protein